jgi:hypothetical protein
MFTYGLLRWMLKRGFSTGFADLFQMKNGMPLRGSFLRETAGDPPRHAAFSDSCFHTMQVFRQSD